jgi:hypothetical protein
MNSKVYFLKTNLVYILLINHKFTDIDIMGVIKASKLTPIIQYSFILPSPVIMHLKQSTNLEQVIFCWVLCGKCNTQYSFIKKKKEKDWKYAISTAANIKCCIYNCSLDKILKSIIKWQIPFLIGGTITGTIMAYYYGFLFTILVNSIMWYVISYLVSKYYYKSKGIDDQKYLIHYGLSKIKSRNKNYSESETKI